MGRAVSFGNAVLSGLQRFGTMNAISVAGLVLRFSGFAILLELHCTLKAIAGWYAFVSILECAFMVVTVRGLGALAGNRLLLRWQLLARSGDFAVSTLFASILQNLYWSGPPILLGFFRGTSSTIGLYAGQRPGFIISDFTWRGAEVVFSAAAGKNSDSATSSDRKLIVFGTKCFLATAMPLCIGLAILAPIVVQIWLRVPRPEMATVMRLTSIGVVADALWVGPLHALWGRGQARQVLLITAEVTALILVLNMALIPRFGAPGSAAAFVISTWCGAIITSVILAREIGASAIDFLRESFSEVLVPSLALAIFVWAVSKTLQPHPWLLVAAAVIGGGVLYSSLYSALLRTRDSSDNPIQFWFKRIRDRQ
jgi:O-antigen/teichoic acid export membrane protein